MVRDFSNVPPYLLFYIIIDREELLLLVPYAMAHIYRLEAAGSFPKRIQLGPNRVGWRLSEVIAWIESRPVGALPDPIDQS